MNQQRLPASPDRLHLDGEVVLRNARRRVMDERLALDFLQQMTRRYGIATLMQIAAVPVAIASPRVGVALALLCVAFFLLPQPKPRYKLGDEPSAEQELKE